MQYLPLPLPNELGVNVTYLKDKLILVRAMQQDPNFKGEHQKKLELLEKILLAKIEANTH